MRKNSYHSACIAEHDAITDMSADIIQTEVAYLAGLFCMLVQRKPVP